MTPPAPLTFGDIEDTSLPLAVLIHGFPDTPYTWRHLGPDLAKRGYRVVAPWLPGYDAATDRPISVGTYVRHVLDVRRSYRADDRAVLIGHDWGAQAGYGVVATEPGAFARFDAQAEASATMQPPPVPTLFLHGARDGAIGAELLGDLAPHLPADGSVAEIVEDVGHFLHLEKPELIATKIGAWLSSS